MPYYRHLSTVTDETAITAEPLGVYPTAQLAHGDKGPGESITFVESLQERQDWTQREDDRFDRSEYVRTPFDHHARYYVAGTAAHYVHLSRKQPGMIAFTKTPEHGISDRQTIMRPGRYLEEYFKHADGTPAYQDSWPEWIAACSASAVTFAIATSADDIEEIYRNGPRSCMSDAGACVGNTGEPSRPFGNQPHPTRVYGDSDLSLAYMGPKSHATARAIIWESKKYYGRLYGNTDVLRVLLEEAGYRDAFDRTYDAQTLTYRSLNGARIKKIAHRDRIVCPYIDGIDTVDDTGDGWLVLGDGSICAQQTCGYSTRQDLCIHCQDDPQSGDHGSYCASCYDDASTCDRCDSLHWDGGDYCDSCQSHMTSCAHCERYIDDDDVRSVEEPDLSLCESCYETHANQCAACENVTIAHSLMHRTARQRRDANGTADLCQSCIDDGYRLCGTCDDVKEHQDSVSRAEMCIDCTEEAETDAATETPDETCDSPTPDGYLFDLRPQSTAPATIIDDERLF